MELKDIKITIFNGVLSKELKYISLQTALDRIKTGRSKSQCELIRKETDKVKLKELKNGLPCVVFSGVFDKRGDENLKTHSGFVILDFDKLDAENKKTELKNNTHIFACWISPSGNGVKALVKIKYPEKHRQHLKSIFKQFSEIDTQNINEERICFESYDPEIYINENSEIYSDYIEEKKEVKNIVTDNDIIESVLKWLTNRGDTFIEGERNLFIYKFAAACCRFGISEGDCCSFCKSNYSSTDFAAKEIEKSVASAYRTNDFKSAEFKGSKLVNTSDKKEIEINTDIYNLEIKPQEVIYGEDVKEDALRLYDNGYENVESTGVPELDTYFKFKKGEVTVITGYGNYGKSSYMKFLMLLQFMIYGKKICIYSPEEYPAHEFYHDFVEMSLGCSCLPNNPNRPSRKKYEEIYDHISKNIFFIYPTKAISTPEYIKQVFLELIIKEKVNFCVIDPFNQLDNDYKTENNVAKYLEKVFKDFARFALQNQISFIIVAHPKSPDKKDKDTGNYTCPDVFDITDGSMWNNKMDNIIVFHKPFMQTDPDNSTCEHWSKKIRRQKIVGKKGCLTFDYDRRKRRFTFNGTDYIQNMIDGKNTVIQPNINFDDTTPF